MKEYPAADNSIAEVVGFGTHLATTLQTYANAFSETSSYLQDIVSSINSTASALSQLQKIIDADTAVEHHQSPEKVLKDEGCEHIMVLAAQCRKIYRLICEIIIMAECGWGAKLPSNNWEMPLFDISSISHRLEDPWLEPWIKRCREELEWLEISLLLILQLTTLAQFQIWSVLIHIRRLVLTFSSSPTRVPGTFEKELAMRGVAARLRSEQIRRGKILEKYRTLQETASSPETGINPLPQIRVHTPGNGNPKDLDTSDEPAIAVRR